MSRHGLRRNTVKLDKAIWDWSLTVSNVTKRMVQSYAKKIFLEAGIENFKASDGWYRRWRSRWKSTTKSNPIDSVETSTKSELDNVKLKLKTNKHKRAEDKEIDNNVQNKVNSELGKPSITTDCSRSESTSNGNRIPSLEGQTNTIEEISNNDINKSNTDLELNLGSAFESLIEPEDTSQVNTNNLVTTVLKSRFNLKHAENIDLQMNNSCISNDTLAFTNKLNEMLVFNKNNEHVIGQNSDILSILTSDNNSNSIVNNLVEDNIEHCFHNEFHIPSLSLSSEIFDNYNQNLLLDNGEIFCKNCVDFHVDDFRCRMKGVDNDLLLSPLSKEDDNENTIDILNVNVVSQLFMPVENIAQAQNEQNVEVDLPVEPVIEKREVPNTKRSKSKKSLMNVHRSRRKGERYLPRFKAKVVAYTKTHSIKAAALKYNVHEGTVSEWVQAKRRESKVQDFQQKKSPDKIETVEMVFVNWLSDMRKEQRLLSQQMIKEKVAHLLAASRNEETSMAEKKTSWINQYLKRLNTQKTRDGEENGSAIEDRSSFSKKYITYPPPFKMEVALYAKKSSQQAAARVFCVARKRIFEWLELFKSKGSTDSMRVDGACYVTDPDVDKEIWSWYRSQTDPPTSKQVREMGRKMYAVKGYKVHCSPGWFYRWRKRHRVPEVKTVHCRLLEWVLGELDRNRCVSHLDLLEHVSTLLPKSVAFKTSGGWAIRFCKRYTSLLQKTPDYATVLPPSMEAKVAQFRKHIQELVTDLGVLPENIGTIDEMPIHFMHSGVKVKEQLIRKPGFNSCQASLVISCLASGELLPTVLIIKGGSPEALLTSTEHVLVFNKSNGCLDPAVMLHWLQNVFLRSQVGGAVSLLVSNHYEPHEDESVANELSTTLCKHEFFPPGCSSKLQPIRVSLSKMFKDKLEEFWNQRLKGRAWDQESSSLSLPTNQDIFSWVSQIHQSLATSFQEEIRRSFDKTLFANYDFPCEEINRDCENTPNEMYW